MTLPPGTTTLNYGGDIILIGVNMDTERFNGIMATLPEADHSTVIGWRQVSGGTLK